MRRCFEGLATALMDDMTSAEWRPLFDHHRDRIAEVFDGQAGLVIHQDTCAGFLNGFTTAGAYFVPDGSVQQEAMFPALGGILLLALAAEADGSPGDAGAFFANLAAQLDANPMDTELSDKEREVMHGLVEASFANTPDVPVTPASLAGFVLGVFYTMPYLDRADATGPLLLVATVRRMAEDAA